jgi:hypothetical protein
VKFGALARSPPFGDARPRTSQLRTVPTARMRVSGATSPTLGWRPRSFRHSTLGLSTQARTSLSSHTALPSVSPFSVPAPCSRLPSPKIPLHLPSIPLQIRLSGGRSRYEGRVEVQIGIPGHLRWGLICGDDWGTLEAMVACRQLGLGYANHGLQVSREKRELLVVTKVCVLGKDCGNTSLGPGNWNL